MILPKKQALLYLCANGILIVCNVALLVYLRERLILDFSKPPKQLELPIWLITQLMGLVLSFITFWGLTVVLKTAKEAAFIWIAALLLVLVHLIIDITSIFIGFQYKSPVKFFIPLLSVVSLCSILYFTISMGFIKTKLLKKYYAWLGVVSLALIILTPITALLYDNFGLTWVLVNPNIMRIIPILISFALYLNLYMSPQQFQLTQTS